MYQFMTAAIISATGVARDGGPNSRSSGCRHYPGNGEGKKKLSFLIIYFLARTSSALSLRPQGREDIRSCHSYCGRARYRKDSHCNGYVAFLIFIRGRHECATCGVMMMMGTHYRDGPGPRGRHSFHCHSRERDLLV